VEEQQRTETQHGFLIVWGHYATRSGLIDTVNEIPLSQKTYRHTPQSKLLEYLVATLAGLPYLKDLSCAAHPLDQDLAVARAWEQESWADYTGVSRALRALTDRDVDRIIAALEVYSQPYRMAEVGQARLVHPYLILDGDLTGLPVARTSQTYPEAAFGHMDDDVQFGYQLALVSLVSPTYGRLWLAGCHHPGNTVSCSEAVPLVRDAEARLGLRPWRRTGLVQQRLAHLGTQLDQTQTRQTAQMRLAEHAAVALHAAQEELAQRQQQVAALAAEYQACQQVAGPYSRLARAEKQVAVSERRCQQRAQKLQQAQARLAQTSALLDQRQASAAELRAHLAALEADNATNAQPVTILMRLDAGFGTHENIAVLAELGYEVITKAKNQKLGQALRRRVDDQTAWTAVGANAEMVGWPQVSFKNAPYPLDSGLERFHLASPRYTVLLHYGDLDVTTDLKAWFQLYNRRQTIEAGIKEGKGVFQLHHLKVRTTPALRLQEYLVLFAANFIRWANHWLMTQRPTATEPDLDVSQLGIKHFVQIAAHLAASVSWHTDGCVLRFSDLSCYADQTLTLTGYCQQLPLPWFSDDRQMPISMVT
jgi:hypothetical protein